MKDSFKRHRTLKKINRWLDNKLGKKRKLKSLVFEVHLVDYCNLNCKGCFHYASLANKEDYYHLDAFKKDFEQLGKVFNNKAKRIHLLGGEPLLSKDIDKYMEIARVNFPKAEINIVTNGILISKMDEHFFTACRKYNININVTVYPINLDYNEIENISKKEKVEITIFGDRTKDNSFMNASLCRNCDNDYKHSFLNCSSANACPNLRKGRLFLCGSVAYFDLLNRYFNLNFDENICSLSIYNHSKNEILDFLRTPNKACGYCDIDLRRKTKNKWARSSNKIEEWVIR